LVVLTDAIGVFIAVRSNYEYAAAVAWILGIGSVAFASSMFVYGALFLRAASKSMGIKVRWRDMPPAAESRYLDWCDAHDIKPLAGDRS
jgi:hypothetical protein